MKRRMLQFTFILFSICFSYAFASTITDSSTGAVYPSEITVERNGSVYELEASGLATRTQYFLNVYSIAHYLEKSDEPIVGSKIEACFDENKAKQFTIVWQRAIKGSLIQSGYMDSFRENLVKKDYARQKHNVNRFLSYFQAGVSKGDEHEIQWFPDGAVVVTFNGEVVGEIVDKSFASTIWSIWFGSSSKVKRDDLVSLLD